MKTKKSGFTLVELLLVISLVTLMVALLLPSLSKARDRAQAVVCGSMLRQAGIATMNYAMSNKGLPPYTGVINGDVHPYSAGYTIFYTLLKNKYFEASGKIRCPANPWIVDTNVDDGHAGENYSVNFMIFGWQYWRFVTGEFNPTSVAVSVTDQTKPYHLPKRLDIEPIPNQCLLIADGSTYIGYPTPVNGASNNNPRMRVYWSWLMGSALGMQGVTLDTDPSAPSVDSLNLYGYWHNDAPNAVFIDGHSEAGHPQRTYNPLVYRGDDDSSKWPFPLSYYRCNPRWYGYYSYLSP